MVPEVRDRCLKRCNEEIIQIPRDPNKTPTELFWEAHEETRKVAKVLTVCLDNHSRSEMLFNMHLMLRHGMLTEKELVDFGFSEELRERIMQYLKWTGTAE